MTIEEHIQTKELTLSRKLTINLVYTAQWAADTLSESLKEFDLSLQQFNVLRILRGQKGKPANLSTISERMVAKASNTTRLVDKLIKKDLVARGICESNRRKVEITITKNGLSLLKKLDVEVSKAENQVTASLTTTEKEQLNNLLNKLRK